jgi:hypothetical protein
MTKIMSACLTMFLLWNNTSQGVDKKEILFSGNASIHSQSTLGSKRLLCKGDANIIDINVLGFNNKVELRLEDANSNIVTLDLSGSIYPTVSVEIDNKSDANIIDIYSWFNVEQQNHGNSNTISVHSPVYQHPIPCAIVAGLILFLGSKMCDK